MNPAPSLYPISFKLIKFLFSNWIYVPLKKIVESRTFFLFNSYQVRDEYLEGAG
jgi:hypothetical protein